MCSHAACIKNLDCDVLLFSVKMISAPGGFLKLSFFWCVCMYLASGTAIGVRDVEPEDVNVRLL